MGKLDQIGAILVISGMLKLFRHYVLAQFHKAGSDIDKALDPVIVFIRGTTNIFEFVERRYFEHFGRTSKSTIYAGWLSFRVRKVIVHILKLMRNFTGSQWYRFRIGVERLKRGALVTTLTMRCNLAISSSGIL